MERKVKVIKRKEQRRAKALDTEAVDDPDARAEVAVMTFYMERYPRIALKKARKLRDVVIT